MANTQEKLRWERLADIVGVVAAGEFENTADHYKPGLLEWVKKLPALSDAEFEQECASAIYDSALVNRFRGNWEHLHFKASACWFESRRRHMAQGHAEDCAGDTIYGRAHARLMREHGYESGDLGTCNCGRAGREVPSGAE